MSVYFEDSVKPLFAEDYDEDKLNFPVFVQPKIDGVRGIYLRPKLGFTGRSLKKHGNKFISNLLSDPKYLGLDGELILGEDPKAKDLCRKTTSAINSYEGEPYFTWYIFDYITDKTITLPYNQRLLELVNRTTALRTYESDHRVNIKVIENRIASNLQELLAFDKEFTDAGYEGTIIRNPYGLHKSGRSTVKEGLLLRIKRFIQEDAVVISITEAMENTNEKKKNELGHSERSSHKENLIPKGMVGNLICRDVKTGNTITVGPGKMTHELRTYYFQNQNELIGKVISYKNFPHGVKDKPRFPTFEHIRIDSDIV